MERARLQAYFRFAAVGSCLAVSAGCGPRLGEQAASPEDVPSADSTRRAVAQRNRSSATQGIDFDETERSKYSRVELMIQARFAGVQVIPSGGGFTIKIRGTGSFTSSNEPLIVVDGALRSTGALSRISPLDVERIEVVKDGTASFYGSRGANGVILITTRRTP